MHYFKQNRTYSIPKDYNHNNNNYIIIIYFFGTQVIHLANPTETVFHNTYRVFVCYNIIENIIIDDGFSFSCVASYQKIKKKTFNIR